MAPRCLCARRRTAAATATAALALLVLLALGVAPAPAAAAPSCASRLRRAMDACHGDMMAVVKASELGGSVDEVAATINPSAACCAAAKNVFAPEYVSECACDAGVAKYTAMVDAAALETLRAAAAARCGAAAADLAPLACATSAAPKAAAFAAAAAGGGGVSIRVVTLADDGYPVGGSGSGCITESCGAEKCLARDYGGDQAKFKAAVYKCYKNVERGYCKTPFAPWNVALPTSPPFDGRRAACGTSACGSGGTLQAFSTTGFVYPGGVSNADTCFKCCKPIGNVVTNDNPPRYPDGRVFTNKNMCSKSAAAGCFPGGARVVTPGGATKALRDVQIGDKIQVFKGDGSLGFEEVYFFDHQLDGEVRFHVMLMLMLTMTRRRRRRRRGAGRSGRGARKGQQGEGTTQNVRTVRRLPFGRQLIQAIALAL